MQKKRKPELIMGIRNQAGLKACAPYADAVYFSTELLSLRARAKEISLKELGAFVAKVHAKGLLAYLTVNSTVNENKLNEASKIIEAAKKARVDAIIAWDPAVILRAKQAGLCVHISTQANVTNHESAEFYRQLGAKRIVLSRELSLAELKEIKKQSKIEIEAFVHGAMCMAISGRCHLSAYVLGKSGNCGECTQPCRWEWTLSGENGIVAESRGKYLLSAKDLCMIEYIPELIEAGIDSFKVEGRLRDPVYLETVARCYREAIEAFWEGNYSAEKAKSWKKELASVYNRGFSTGFYFGVPGLEGFAPSLDMKAAKQTKKAAGVVRNYYPKKQAAAIQLLERGLKLGDELIIEGSTTYLRQKVKSLMREGKKLEAVKKGEEAGLFVEAKVRKNDRIYII
ncbi:MAG: U32 family peptidase [Methanosarcinaceae archaeon]|nr:U32 family peptidase [Methanosarcinaceae archaeon]MDD4332444.1 U32 family peptidase [Methanosarcinaceae archaeon]MDD4749890.1 U32 family peptidase [Methanosarcinaceae archaeon]